MLFLGLKACVHAFEQVCAMAGITAEKLKDRQTVSLGVWHHPRITRALFDTYLGPLPVDAAGKMQAGQGALYVTNGFR